VLRWRRDIPYAEIETIPYAEIETMQKKCE